MTVKKDSWPYPVEPANLRKHFETVYRLDRNQVDLMLESSAKSLRITLGKLNNAIDNNQGYSEISRLGHSLKGLLLNMGEPEWAELARFIEKAAGAEQQEDYRGIVGGICRGVEQLLNGS